MKTTSITFESLQHNAIYQTGENIQIQPGTKTFYRLLNDFQGNMIIKIDSAPSVEKEYILIPANKNIDHPILMLPMRD